MDHCFSMVESTFADKTVNPAHATVDFSTHNCSIYQLSRKCFAIKRGCDVKKISFPFRKFNQIQKVVDGLDPVAMEDNCKGNQQGDAGRKVNVESRLSRGKMEKSDKGTVKNRYVKDIVCTISTAIESMLGRLTYPEESCIKDFHCKGNPQLSLSSYVTRVVSLINYWELCSTLSRKHSEIPCGLRSLIISLIYLDRISLNYSKHMIPINQKTIYRLIFIAIVIATKYNEDHDVSLRFMSKVGGISVSEIKHLEILFLNAIEFRLLVSDQQFQLIYDRFISLTQDTISNKFKSSDAPL